MNAISKEDLKCTFSVINNRQDHKVFGAIVAQIFGAESAKDLSHTEFGLVFSPAYPMFINIHNDFSFDWHEASKRSATYKRRFDYKTFRVGETEKDSDLENQLKAVEKLSDSKSEEIFKLKQEVEQLETNLEQANQWVEKLSKENTKHKTDKIELVKENETLRSDLADAKNMVPEREQLLIDRYRSLCEVVTHQAGATQALFNQMTYETLGEQQAVNVDFQEQQPYNEGSSNQ